MCVKTKEGSQIYFPFRWLHLIAVKCLYFDIQTILFHIKAKPTLHHMDWHFSSRAEIFIMSKIKKLESNHLISFF